MLLVGSDIPTKLLSADISFEGFFVELNLLTLKVVKLNHI